MPFVSKAQQRWGNSPSGLEALGGASNVKEWNDKTPKTIPNKVRHVGALKKATDKVKEAKNGNKRIHTTAF